MQSFLVWSTLRAKRLYTLKQRYLSYLRYLRLAVRRDRDGVDAEQPLRQHGPHLHRRLQQRRCAPPVQ